MDIATSSTEWSRKFCTSTVRFDKLTTNSPLDEVCSFETLNEGTKTRVPTRFAVRDAMNIEHQRWSMRRQAEARQARYYPAAERDSHDPGSARVAPPGPMTGGQGLHTGSMKTDFFGRPLNWPKPHSSEGLDAVSEIGSQKEENRIWVTYNEGYSNAVRKPVTLKELLRGFEKPA